MSSESRPILNIPRRQSSIARSPFSTSFLSASPLAQESIARDLAESSCDEDEAVSAEEESSEESDTPTVRPGPVSHSMSGSYRRPSFVAYGGPRPALTPQCPEVRHLTKKEKKQVWSEEESLLRDNHLAPPKTPRSEEISSFRRIYRYLFSTKIRRAEDEERIGRPLFHDPFPPPTEISALLGQPETAREGHERRNRIWEDAVREGKIQTTWQREAMTLSRYSSPLMVTFILQYTLTVASIFTVGHLGKIELGAGEKYGRHMMTFANVD
jgi:MATE family multidrug resistance protein